MQEEQLNLENTEIELLQADPNSVEEKTEPVFGIKIGSLGFLVSPKKYCEILDKVQVNALPNVHPWLSGLVNLRGNLVPVFDLRLLLEESGDNKKRRLFTIDRGEQAVALWIETYPEIKNRMAMKAVKKQPALPEVIKRYVTGCYEQGGQIWLDIKFEELFKTLGRHQFAAEEVA